MSMSTPSSEPAPHEGELVARYTGGTLIVLLVGALMMVAVARTAPSGRDLPLLPAAGIAGAESLSLAAPNPPTSLQPGIVAPADQAPAYLLRGGTSGEVVSALTVALGLTAGSDSRSDERGFVVVDRGSDRVLHVSRAPGHPWTLTRGDADCIDRPDATISSDGRISCPESGVGSPEAGQIGGSPGAASTSPDGAGATGGESVRCPPVECPEGQACAQVCPGPEPLSTAPAPQPVRAPIDLPSPEDAERRSREILNAMGLEVARTTLSAAPDGSGWQTLVEVAVGGLTAVGLDTHLLIGEDAEVVSGSGMIPDVELLGSYPLIDAAGALTRLQERLEPLPGGIEPAPAGGFTPEGPASVIGMRLVLLLQAATAGSRTGDYLVPAYLVDSSDGAVFHVPAATDEHLAASG